MPPKKTKASDKKNETSDTIEEVSVYAKYKGLRFKDPDFDKHVMHFEEIIKLFSGDVKYHAHFTYPFLPADGFQYAPKFYQAKPSEKTSKKKKSEEDNYTITLVSDISVNQSPTSVEGTVAKSTLPKLFSMSDKLQFFSAEKRGKFQISTIASSHKLTKYFLSSKKRPGLFLKIKSTEENDFREDVFIYYPAQPNCTIQKQVVPYGQAFVLVKEGVQLTKQMIRDIIQSFKILIQESYGELGGLHHVDTHQTIEAYLKNLSELSEDDDHVPDENPEDDTKKTQSALTL